MISRIYVNQKNLLLLIILGISSLLLWGCSNSSNESQNQPSTTSTEQTNSDLNPMYTITGIVFLDANGNGIMESDESGLPDITIKNQFSESHTDSDGQFILESQQGNDLISVVQNSLPPGLMLTTSNASQAFTVSGHIESDPIGYTYPVPDAPSYTFKDTITTDSTYDNYYFELQMSNAGQLNETMKLWVIGQSMKAETQGLITYYNHENGTMGVYAAETNQVVITPIMEEMPIVTPFTFVDELDAQTFDEIAYRGEEDLDDKEVLVFENTSPGFEATYYVWKEHPMIIKMETKSGSFESSFYFKDLSLGTVTPDDITYPAGAEVLNLSGQ
ncbi:hypothetical protein [Fusibacter ferrireducens]|uniref:SD-repeat containing protein B domain-containing protein n=1 Tax=Fusibacter ferrireducens TaxID=2785058 RepID=A0ABR9ZPI3_9FIRM|nr:hypothetical protein [Fusibacter ferrireducens]MBF4692372.1 hypothetical protein [Fusibacter ferrireducens]